jgi:hypothetical protein
MASFAMVFAGAPLFMWVFAIRTAVFISNISASYYSKQSIWSTPYALVHGESFPDASIVVPFGCAVLVLRDSDDGPKFKNRAVMMVFVHYSTDHPLFTYAVYSPRSKRVLHRQDVIFLTSVFPMRTARVVSGLGPEGEALTVFRSPASLLDGCDPALSFGDWKATDSLPEFDDDITGFNLVSPYEDLVDFPEALEGVPVFNPTHPSFPSSSVLVPIPAVPISGVNTDMEDATVICPDGRDVNLVVLQEDMEGSFEPPYDPPSVMTSQQDELVQRDSIDESNDDETAIAVPQEDALRRPIRRSTRGKPPPPTSQVTRRPVRDRWIFEPVFSVGTALVSAALLSTPSTGSGSEPTTSSGSVLEGSSDSADGVFPAGSLVVLPPPLPPPPFFGVDCGRTHRPVPHQSPFS